MRKSTKFSVLDIDSCLLDKLGFVEVIDTLKEILLDFGLKETQIHVERSGLKGYHSWVFFADFLKAKIAIEWAKVVGRELYSRTERDWSIDNSFYKCEIRPEGETENTRCIKLPLSIHRENGQRSVFVNDNLNPYRDQGKRIEIAGDNRVGSSVIFEVVRDRCPTGVQLELGLGDNNELYDLLLRTGAACLLYYAKNGLDGLGQRHEVMLSLAIALDSLGIPRKKFLV